MRKVTTMNVGIRLFIGLVITSLQLATAAGTFYISLDGDDSSTGTIDAPLATFAEAAARVQPGDTVIVRGGTYSERVVLTTSGTAAAPIVWMVHTQEAVTINGIDRPLNGFDPSSERPQWEFANCDYQEVYDFKIVNSPSYGISDAWGASNHLHLEGLIVLDCHETGVYLQGDNHFLRDCQSGYNFDYAGNEYLYGSANAAGGNADGFCLEGSNSNLYHCLAFNNSDDGFDFWDGDNNNLAECVSYKNGSENGARDRDKSAYASLPFGGNGSGFLMGRGGDDYQAFNTAIKCLAFANPAAGFDQNGGGGVRFFHCTSYNNATNFASWDHPANTGELETVYKNNLSHQGALDITGTFNEQHNSWDATISVAVTDDDFMNLDPTSGNFLKLAFGSDCIDAGTDIGQPYEGSAPDLGYHERSESTAIGEVPLSAALWNIYPVPATGSVFVDLSELEYNQVISANLSLLDLEGRLISYEQTNGPVTELSLDGLAPGLYVVKLDIEEGSDSQLITVK